MERKIETQENYARDTEHEIKMWRVENEMMDLETEYVMSSVVVVYYIEKDRTVKVKGRVRNRWWWGNSYRNWDDHMFKTTLRVNKETFIFLLLQIRADIEKTSSRRKLTQ